MPPRYAYWTILVDDQPTAFRAGAKEDLLPTFNRLKEKHGSATMMWFQNGKLWPSRVDAQEAMHARGEMGRRGDARQGGGFRDRPSSPRAGRSTSPRGSERPDWTPKPASSQARTPSGSDKLDWKPKGTFTPAPKRSERPERSEWKPKSSVDRDRKPDWKPKGSFDRERKTEWKPKGSFDRERKTEWKPKGSFDRDRKTEWKPKASFDRDRKPEWKPKGSFDRDSKSEWKPKGPGDRNRKPEWKSKTSRPDKLEWKPKTESGTRNAEPETRAKRVWIPKEEYKKSKGIETPRDSKWRPGGAHRDPRQKYKDAKKAKWSRFKQNIRQKSGEKRGRKKDDDK
jgi:hypothetical protein